MKSPYTATFYKMICGPMGHMHRCHQGRVVVEGFDDRDAAEKAKDKFAQMRGLKDWTYAADELELEQVGEGERLQ